MRVNINPGMVDISAPGMEYGNIMGMYQNGDAHGLQINEELEPQRREIIDLCDSIAGKIYELQSLVSA